VIMRADERMGDNGRKSTIRWVGVGLGLGLWGRVNRAGSGKWLGFGKVSGS
jgi:hypothetical protein